MPPTYEYECQACGHGFERFESISARPNPKCPKCGRRKAKRRISGGAGLIFKGAGFYLTDYRKAAQKPNCASCQDKSSPRPSQETILEGQDIARCPP